MSNRIMSNWLQGSSPSIQTTTSPQKTSTQTLQGSSPNLQPTYSPQPAGSGGYTLGSTSPVSQFQQVQAPAGPSPEQIAQQQAAQQAAQKAAEEAARVKSLQGGITKLISDAMGVYDQLYGDVRGAATSQRRLLDKRFDRESSGLTDQFNQELPKIGRAYAGRGAYDSSYREGAEEQATQGFENQIGDISMQRDEDAAKIGQALREQEAQFGSQKGLLQTIQGRLGETNDVNELTQLRNEMDRRIAELSASRAGNQSRESQMQRFNQLAPAGDRMGQLSQTLSSVINGQAPGPLKRAVAQQIIGSAGLPKREQDQLLQQVNSQIG